MKKCPHCAEEDLQDDAKVCKHCKHSLVEESKFGCLTAIFTTGVVLCALGGFFWWPLWILAAVLLLVMISDK